RTNLDAAIARIADTIDDFYPWHYTGVGEIDPRPVTDRFSVHEVVKRGATTNVTRGHVSAFDLDGIELDYTTPRGTETITFNNLLEFTHRRPTRWDFSAGGDSGSLIIDEETMRPYALLIGGGPDDDGIDRTLGHFIPEVLDRLGVSFVR
ncbi:MAG: hypothetical protein OER88_06020, partial [Planctomycetota bacterium]|nr:hypothetical protein [Planctomycetota bacterium]